MTEDMITVRIVGLPVELQARAATRLETLQREFELIRHAEGGDDSVPARLRLLIDELQIRYGGVGADPDAVLQAARGEGAPSVDLEYHVPPDIGDATRRLRDLLAETDDYCRAGNLLTLAAPADEVDLREWFLGEFIRQVEGEPPTPWTANGRDVTTPSQPPGDDRVDLAPSDGAPSDGAGALPDVGPGWTIAVDDDTARITYRGELDLQSAPDLRSLVAHLGQIGFEQLEVDLRDVPFMDSVGLSVLLSTQLRLRSEGVTLRVDASPAVRQVLELAAATELLGGATSGG